VFTQSCLQPPDDLIVSCSGTLGKVAIAPQNAPRGIINQALLRIRVDKSLLTPLYLKHALESMEIQNQLLGLSHGTGLQNFPPMSEVKALAIPLAPIEDQIRFHNHLQAVGKQRRLVDESATEINSLFSTLQHRAFRGEL
jgi:type I restriction enzyme S subunit